MPERLLQLEDIKNARNPEKIAVLFQKLGYNASAEPLAVEALELPPRSAEAVIDAYVIANEETDKLLVWLFQLRPKEFSESAKSRMKAIAESLCQRPCNFLLLGTKDYQQVLLVNPQQSFDDDLQLKFSVNFWELNLKKPTVYDLNMLEAIAAFDTAEKGDLYKIICESFARFQQKPTKKSKSYTGDSIRSYLQEIGIFQLLTKGEELELGGQIFRLQELEYLRKELTDELGRQPQDDEWAKKVGMELENFKRFLGALRKAREKMIVSNLRLVVAIAKKYQNRGVDFLDLIQEGNLGLIKAVDKFDPDKGYKFSTYAYWWIRSGIQRAIANYSRTIRLPAHVHQTISDIKKITHKISQKTGRKAPEHEIANNLGITEEKLQELRKGTQQTLSLDVETGDDKDSKLIELIPSDEPIPQEKIERNLLKQNIERVLRDTLGDREQYVMRMRSGFDDGKKKSLQKIGDKLNLCREQIRQIENKALRKLRKGDWQLLL